MADDLTKLTNQIPYVLQIIKIILNNFLFSYFLVDNHFCCKYIIKKSNYSFHFCLLLMLQLFLEFHEITHKQAWGCWRFMEFVFWWQKSRSNCSSWWYRGLGMAFQLHRKLYSNFYPFYQFSFFPFWCIQYMSLPWL